MPPEMSCIKWAVEMGVAPGATLRKPNAPRAFVTRQATRRFNPRVPRGAHSVRVGDQLDRSAGQYR